MAVNLASKMVSLALPTITVRSQYAIPCDPGGPVQGCSVMSSHPLWSAVRRYGAHPPTPGVTNSLVP